MLCIKVSLGSAQVVMDYLAAHNLYNRSHKAKKIAGFIYFPITKKAGLKKKFPRAEFHDMDFQTISSKHYSSLLPGIRDSLPASYDIIGDIIIIDIPKELAEHQKKIGEALLKTHKNIKTVLKKSGIHSGEFRLQRLHHIAGEKKKETTYTENNIRLKLDVEKVYFSPRLSTERKRIFSMVGSGETILVMFSGVGPYPISISKNTRAKEIVAIEKNPAAHTYCLDNIRLNKCTNIQALCGDVKKIIPALEMKFDRIIMPLPKQAETFLREAFLVSKPGTIIHLYGFEHENEQDNMIEKAQAQAKKHQVGIAVLRLIKCGQYSPGKFRLCLDFRIK